MSAPRMKRAPRVSTMIEQEALAHYYKLGDTIGKGGFGKVKLATHILTGQTVAIKILDKHALGEEIDRALQEIAILKELQHPRICQLFEVIDKPDKLYIVLEYCANGELFEYIFTQKNGILSEKDARKIFRQVISAVAYCHKKGCVHRDLKPENLLLDREQNIKLIDFGLAAKPPGMSSLLRTCCGSPQYVAPEVISGNLYSGPPADVWSLGVLLYVLLVGSLPFKDDDTDKLYEKIKKGSFSMPNYLTLEAKALLKKMINTNPKERISMDALISDAWVKGGYTTPVRWNFCPDVQLSIDPALIRGIASILPHYGTDLRESIIKRKFDYVYATYQILKLRARMKLPLTLYHPQTGAPIKCQPNVHPLTPITTPLQRLASPPAKDDLNISYDNFESGSSSSPLKTFAKPAPVTPRNQQKTSAESLPEDRVRMPPPQDYRLTVPKGERITPSKSWGNGLDHLEEPNSAKRYVGDKCKSMDDGLENLIAFDDKPKKLKASGMKKFFGSVEKSFDKMVDFLTPTKNGGQQMRAIKSTEATNNITFVNSNDPLFVMQEIQKALDLCGFSWKMKKNRDFLIKASKKKEGARKNEMLLKISLEVCFIVDRRTCGIRRERLEGDTMDYLKHYAHLHGEILRLASQERPPEKEEWSGATPMKVKF